jgi:hypothetical protein
MAINIFSGNSGSNKRTNSASFSSRAQAAKEAVGGNAVTSDSGLTAVKAPGTLAKVGNIVGNVAGIASKFLPGIGGTIAKGVANILNDPEWWQSVPGEQITMNVPLRIAATGKRGDDNNTPVYAVRPGFVEFISGETLDGTWHGVIDPDERMITQYLMPQIRKVVNAVPLQSAGSYRAVLMAHAEVYAIWRHLKKCDYLLKHGQTYLPNLNSSAFPIFQIANAAWLQSTINRLEEYLRANVRLPHTLCEYLAWRFGRFYRSHASKRAGIVSYSPISLSDSIEQINGQIDKLFAIPTSTEEYQKANTDIYNAYFDHDLMVEIRDDTQLSYDPKEFALRTNLDIQKKSANPTGIPVYIDSALDNTTVFMASTVSTKWMPVEKLDIMQGEPYAFAQSLFPVSAMIVYIYADAEIRTADNVQLIMAAGWTAIPFYGGKDFDAMGDSAHLVLASLKAMDIYNKNIYTSYRYGETQILIDITQPASDLGVTSDVVIQNEQVFAFANLVNVDRKRSMTVGAADKIAAAEVANLVEKVDVATSGTPAVHK